MVEDKSNFSPLKKMNIFLYPLVAPSQASALQKPAATGTTNSKKGPVKTSEQRYFRIPFIRPNEKNIDGNGEQKKKGWWYAHFDGTSVFLFQANIRTFSFVFNRTF